MSIESQVRAAVSAYFDAVPGRSSGRELVFICTQPGCGDVNGNRSVNLDTAKTSCWRCNKGGDFFTWASFNGVDIERDESIGPAVGLDVLGGMLSDLGKVHVRRVTGTYSAGVDLPPGFIPLSPTPTPYNMYEKWIGKMARRKNLEYADMYAAGVGYTRECMPWEPFAIFPVREWDRIVYYQGRTYRDIKGESTKKFPSKFECELSARHWVYNLDELRLKGGVAVVVESILNVLSLKKELARRGITGFVPVAVFKHKVSQEQLSKLAECTSVTEVCMLYDEDAISSIYSECRRLLGRTHMTFVKMPKKVDANDDAALAVDLLLKRQGYSDSTSLLDALSILVPKRRSAGADERQNKPRGSGRYRPKN